jgi:hypothetical protein
MSYEIKKMTNEILRMLDEKKNDLVIVAHMTILKNANKISRMYHEITKMTESL